MIKVKKRTKFPVFEVFYIFCVSWFEGDAHGLMLFLSLQCVCDCIHISSGFFLTFSMCLKAQISSECSGEIENVEFENVVFGFMFLI